jgi:ubiquinol-cytochrome c reductase cytochrome c subunit
MRQLAVVLFIVAAATACAYGGGRSKRYEPPGIEAIGRPDSGRAWYQRDCAWCHGDGGQGTPNGPDLHGERNGPALTDFMLRTGRMPLVDVTETVRHRRAKYSQRTIDQIVAYVASFGAGGPAVPSPAPHAGDVALGQDLYQTNCAPCHSTTGIGGTLTQQRSRDVAGGVARRTDVRIPDVRRAGAVEIEEAMLTGPGTMPVFGAETFSEREIDSIVRYVLYLHDPPQRGGGELGRVGPVAEGAVAWVVGLGALLLLARWIGKTADERG